MKKFAVNCFASLVVMLLAVSVFASFARASEDIKEETKTDVLLYHVPIQYDDSLVKDSATVTGAYIYYGQGTSRSFEFGADYTSIDYLNNSGYTQRDYTFAMSKYKENKKSRFGLHVAVASLSTYDAFTLFAGMGSTNNGRDRTADLYVSSYKNLGPDLKAYQVSLSSGQYLKGQHKTYSLTSVNIIHITRNAGLAEKNYASLEQAFTWFTGNVNITLHGWVGREAFAVKNSGFVVYNKAEEYTGSYGVSFQWPLKNETSLTLGANREHFSDAGRSNSVTGTSYTLMLGRNF